MSYSESYFTTRETWRDWRIEARELMRLARVTRDARVLEIGCGGGGLLRMLREHGARAVGVDTLGAALELARAREMSLRAERSNLQTTVGIASSQRTLLAMTLTRIGEDGALPFRANAFDALIGQHVVEHLPDMDAALREYKRVLRSPDPREGKAGGRLALATPNARYPDPTHFADVDHAHVFSPNELRDAVTRAGFIVERCFTIFPFLSRVRALRAFGVIAYRVFRRAPYFAMRGRTIMIVARR